MAESLVWTSLRGTDSHGVARVPVYVERLRDGDHQQPRPRPSVLRRDGAVAVVDGDRGPGQVASVFATDLSVELAREHGVGVVTVRHSGHNGAQAFYAMRAAEQGMVAIALTNTEPLVIPHGGAEPALGTNPICLAAPSADGVFDLDMATSQVAMNRICNARDEGRPIPESWGVDARRAADHRRRRGRRRRCRSAATRATRSAVMVEVLCGVLAGAGVRHGVGQLYGEGGEQQDIGHFHLAIDPERTVGRDRFAAVLGGLLDELRAIPPAPGFDEVLAPGDPEDRARAERERVGRADRAGAVADAVRAQPRAGRGRAGPANVNCGWVGERESGPGGGILHPILPRGRYRPLGRTVSCSSGVQPHQDRMLRRNPPRGRLTSFPTQPGLTFARATPAARRTARRGSPAGSRGRPRARSSSSRRRTRCGGRPPR